MQPDGERHCVRIAERCFLAGYSKRDARLASSSSKASRLALPGAGLCWPFSARIQPIRRVRFYTKAALHCTKAHLDSEGELGSFAC